MGNPLMSPQAPMAQPMAPQGQPMGAPQQPDPAVMQEAHKHLGIVTNGLMNLIAQKPGTLTKQDVLASAADMIKDGAFPEPQGRQALITQLAQLPDDEGQIRQFLGQHLMNFAAAQTHVASTMGTPQGG
jgi:hypothetical protein